MWDGSNVEVDFEMTLRLCEPNVGWEAIAALSGERFVSKVPQRSASFVTSPQKRRSRGNGTDCDNRQGKAIGDVDQAEGNPTIIKLSVIAQLFPTLY